MPYVKEFPKTMKRGLFKGRRFESLAEYERALAESRPARLAKRKGKAVVEEGDRFHLTCIIHGVTYEVYGPLRPNREVDTLLDAITEVTGSLVK